jgi:hypothetical protein
VTYCGFCGQPLSTPFCTSCGKPAPMRAASSSETVMSAEFSEAVRWQDEVRYETLIRVPEVRDRIARAAATKQGRMSAEEFLAMADQVVSLVGIKMVSLKTLANVVLPIYERIGIKTGKTRSETLEMPVGATIVAALCAFAAQGQGIRQVQQFENGCLLEVSIPSDAWSWEGSLFVTIRSDRSNTRVDAATTIKGQLFDWGKSQRLLITLFSALESAR